ncbi:sperm microtubule associated protein 1-like [Hemiscyllium ocellatum]|uniref:sperm microtubule associated protein 1-like n=1 Tax=Hemiscyllium ocellatum TaxID=170820 RepID=UPI0029661F58|nr:sperm microtubule associated protein 1-like [Hemiscyllium ocellatum]
MVMMPSGLPPRFAPSPPKAELKRREKAFLLDCVAISSIARDYSYSAPKAGTVIPPYNAQNDRHALAYFRTKPLPPLLKKTGQSRGGTSIHGVTVDRFQFQGSAAGYLQTRNKNGAGHSADQVKGHSLFLSEIKPIFGYNGLYGYRRNTPALRKVPSPFGVITRSAIH